MLLTDRQGVVGCGRSGPGHAWPAKWVVAIFLVLANSKAQAVSVTSFVLVKVESVKIAVIRQSAAPAPFEVIYRLNSKVLYSANPVFKAGKTIRIYARRTQPFLGHFAGPRILPPVALPGIDLVMPVIWFRHEWEYDASWQAFSAFRIGIRSAPMPVAKGDVPALIRALKALRARRNFLPATLFPSPADGAEKTRKAAKIDADGRKLLASQNYFLWALGAYETVAFGSRAETIGLLRLLLKTRPPAARMRAQLHLPKATETIRPVLSLRRATWLAYLLSRPLVPRKNRLPASVITAYFFHFLRIYEAPDKGSYIPMSPSGFGLPRIPQAEIPKKRCRNQ